ncbi:hypothetical protein GCM10008983_10870 [Lentibacillus halophilus]|uniref:Uncharacterized protein n=1 Tax=Lentibacillus halophilus TaxID=295065 RepID=A0ABN0Z6Q3_9BACI
MRNVYEKYIRLEFVTLGLAIVTGIIAIMQGYVIMMTGSLYFIAASLFCEGVLHTSTNNAQDGIKQLIKAGMVAILSTIMLFQL